MRKTIIKKSTLCEDYEDGLNEFNDELRMYEQMPVSRLSEDPIQFWKNNITSFPSLHTIAMKYLSIPGSSATSERVFSCAGFVADELRNILSSRNVEMLVFCDIIGKMLMRIKNKVN